VKIGANIINTEVLGRKVNINRNKIIKPWFTQEIKILGKKGKLI